MNIMAFSVGPEWWINEQRLLVPCFITVGTAEFTVCTGIYGSFATRHTVKTTASPARAAEAAAHLAQRWEDSRA